MKIWIKNTDKYPMWAIPDLCLHLSYLDNTPKTLDLQSMTPLQKKTVWVDIQFGKIETDNFEELRLSLFPPPVVVPEVKSVAKLEEVVTMNITENNITNEVSEVTLSDLPSPELPSLSKIVDRSDDLKLFLEKSVATLKRELPVIQNVSDWKRLLELEINNKNRKTVVSMLNELITNFNNQVSRSILAEPPKSMGMGSSGTSALYGKLGQRYAQNISDIIESDIETVEIKLE